MTRYTSPECDFPPNSITYSARLINQNKPNRRVSAPQTAQRDCGRDGVKVKFRKPGTVENEEYGYEKHFWAVKERERTTDTPNRSWWSASDLPGSECSTSEKGQRGN